MCLFDIYLVALYLGIFAVEARIVQFEKAFPKNILLRIISEILALVLVLSLFFIIPLYIYVRINIMPPSWGTLWAVVNYLLGNVVILIILALPFSLAYLLFIGIIYFILGPKIISGLSNESFNIILGVVTMATLLGIALYTTNTTSGKLLICHVRNEMFLFVFGNTGPEPFDDPKNLCVTDFQKPFDLSQSSISLSNAYYNLVNIINNIGVDINISKLIAIILGLLSLMADILGIYSFLKSRHLHKNNSTKISAISNN